jgi:SagB-type dehydrogenase family enzyme
VYAVTRDAVYRYDPPAHQLIVHLRGDPRAALYEVALRQDAILRAPATLVIAAVSARTAIKYGEERTPRYVALEAGHAAQNVLLQAVALDLGAVPIGAFLDDQVQQALTLPREHQPLYLIPVGHPK